MDRINHIRSAKRRLKAPLMLVGVFIGGAALSSCSQVPDAVNPAEWYRGTVDFFAGEDDTAKKDKDAKEGGLAADRGKAPPGSDKSFPNLASVDEKARARDNTGGGLSADSERPKYAPAPARQGAASEPLKPRPRPVPVAPVTPSTAATQPPPQAVPTAPVARAPISQPTAQPEPKMASPKVSPQFAPPVMTADQKATQERLARQLAEIRARAANLGDIPVASSPPAIAAAPAGPAGQGAGEGEGTLVISSEGVVSGAHMAAVETPRPGQPSVPSGQMAAESTMQTGPSPFPGTAVRVATILFDNGSFRLKARDRQILSAVVRLQKKQGGQVRIVGHASSRTRNLPPVKHKMANFKISADRADKVAGELIRLRVNKTQIQIAAVSDTEPLYFEFMPSGEAGNRRTEVYLVN